MKLLHKLDKKQKTLAVIVLVSLVLLAALATSAFFIKVSLPEQRAAVRWAPEGGYAQVSCFFAEGEKLSLDNIMAFRSQIEKSLREASRAVGPESGRAYIDAYSSEGTVQLISERSRLDVRAIGVGGDFFHFHPLALVSGSYFSATDINKDGILIDDEAAWQLFGSSDIIGMEVLIGGRPHFIRGVINRRSGRLWDAAGLADGVVYLSQESLATYGTSGSISHYEYVAPNPVSGFASRIAVDNFNYAAERMTTIDNSARFDFFPLMDVITQAGTRSMQSYAFRYPYWENYARGIDDILALMLAFELLFLLVPTLIIVTWLIIVFRRRHVPIWDRVVMINAYFTELQAQRLRKKQVEAFKD